MKKRMIVVLVPIAALAMGYGLSVPDQPADHDNEVLSRPVGDAGLPYSQDLPAPGAVRLSGHGEGSRILPTTGCKPVTRYLPTDVGVATEVVTCESGYEPAEHPYQGYPNVALESLAYSDARAAEILGMRLREVDNRAAMKLILRASALSGGDVRPISAFANAYPHPVAVNGEVVRQTVHVKFVLSTVAEMLGAVTAGRPHWEAIIRRHSMSPDQEIALLEQRARRIVEEMRKIQRDVTGTSTIGGQSDA